MYGTLLLPGLRITVIRVYALNTLYYPVLLCVIYYIPCVVKERCVVLVYVIMPITQCSTYVVLYTTIF